MDAERIVWYYSCMMPQSKIPVFNLFGETGSFPDIIHCERIIDRASQHDWVIPAHRHREMSQIFFMERGQAQVQIDGTMWHLSDGDFLFISSQVVHGFVFTKGSVGLVFSFPQPVMQAAAGEPALIAHLSEPFGGRIDQRARALMDHLVTTFADTAPFRASALVALSQALFAYLAGLSVRHRTDTDPLNRRRMIEFDRLITTHLAEAWTATDYARALSITAGHLNRICQLATGQSVTRHIETAVMTEASRLLAFTRLPVAEVGYRLGFVDPSYFSRRFKALRGQSPSDYRAGFDV